MAENRFENVDMGSNEARRIRLFKKQMVENLEALIQEWGISSNTPISDVIKKLKD